MAKVHSEHTFLFIKAGTKTCMYYDFYQFVDQTTGRALKPDHLFSAGLQPSLVQACLQSIPSSHTDSPSL